MKRFSFMEVRGGGARNCWAMLGLLVLSMCVAMPANAQERRGRMVGAPAANDARQAGIAEAAAVIMDQEAREALARITTGEHRSHFFANPILETRFIRIDVSENAKRFVFDETPLHADGAPAYGNEFVTEGYIYPAGTLTGTNGVKEDGSPEFPEKVIGRWTCRGWHVGDGAKTVTGPWVVTHQLFDFGPDAGRTTIATDGVELVDLDVPVLRAVIGGTGPFANVKGEARQVMIGFNQLNGVNLRLEIKVIGR